MPIPASASARAPSASQAEMSIHSKHRLTALLVVLLAACSKDAASQKPALPPAQGADANSSSDIARNETPLPVYPHLVKATMLAVPNPTTGCVEYMSSTNDALSDAVAWYRSRLGGAKETLFQGDYQGVDFTVNSTDQVLVFALGHTGTSITLRHATTGKSCGRADGRAG